VVEPIYPKALKMWVKTKNPASAAVRREKEADWQ
jgi:hypothetical protein